MKRHRICLGIAFVAMLAMAAPRPATAQIIDIAKGGSAILGHHTLDDGTLGTPRQNSGVYANINDNNLTTRVDNYGGGTGDLDYVGITFASPINTPVSQLVLRHASFYDGGWFGNTAGPGALGALTAGDLIAPKVQITTDGGATWTDVAATYNYVTAMSGHMLTNGAPAGPSPAVTFNLAGQPIGINGIRLFGDGGGSPGGDATGFLGVYELDVMAVPTANFNIARYGTGIIGVNGLDNGTLGTTVTNAGTAANLIDGSLTTRVDTYNGGGAETFDYAGVMFDSQVEGIYKFVLHHATFGDGGWFASDNSNTDATLQAPDIQVTTDGGVTWTDVSGVTNDYLSVLSGNVPSPAGSLESPVTFLFNALGPINGIRAFGNGGGSASGGFIGAFEIEVFAQQLSVPEPMSIAVWSLLGAGACAGIVWRNRTRRK